MRLGDSSLTSRLEHIGKPRIQYKEEAGGTEVQIQILTAPTSPPLAYYSIKKEWTGAKAGNERGRPEDGMQPKPTNSLSNTDRHKQHGTPRKARMRHIAHHNCHHRR